MNITLTLWVNTRPLRFSGTADHVIEQIRGLKPERHELEIHLPKCEADKLSAAIAELYSS